MKAGSVNNRECLFRVILCVHGVFPSALNKTSVCEFKKCSLLDCFCLGVLKIYFYFLCANTSAIVETALCWQFSMFLYIMSRISLIMRTGNGTAW